MNLAKNNIANYAINLTIEAEENFDASIGVKTLCLYPDGAGLKSSCLTIAFVNFPGETH